ncbi:MAG: hypothetical protein ABR928_18060 [Terracidiphilus sp.]|jgi:hypothetical protein
MIDHRLLYEMSKALHVYLDLSFMVCVVIAFVHADGVTRTAPVAARATHGARR